ncbi:universal stress protein [Streptosporangium sp. NPDC023615]|uniref:universal stress protein n=1 Tax=Streptosporangium sp. NPDC023615 TaxID=3154794 RepID=UPI00342F4719
MSHVIVVGADGSAGGNAAVAWAADDAARMKAPLRIVCAVDRQPYQIARYPGPELSDALDRGAQKVLAEAETTARERHPDLDITTEAVQEAPAAALRAQAEGAGEVVVGSRGLGGFARAVLGSVSDRVAGYTHGPVVVVRSSPQTAHHEIVVGIDDSTACEAAVGYAFEQADLRACTLRAIYAWQPPVHTYVSETDYDMEEVRALQRRIAADRLQPWREKYPQVQVVEDLCCAHPVDALTDASDRADLVVVGSHGRGAIGSAVLGSVSRGVLHHARSTVAVVRPQETM